MMGKVIYDWVSISSKIHSATDIVAMLGIEGAVWETIKGAHGYQDRYYWNSISVHFNGRDDMGVWLEMSGQGCRAFESYGHGNYDVLFDEALYNAGEMNITRLDVAYDDLDENLLDIAQLCEDTRRGEYVSKFNAWRVIEGSGGQSVEHGSMKSDLFIRIYDKAAERGFNDGRHWVRVELQMRDKRAAAFAARNGSVGELFSGVLLNYLRYVDDDDCGDSNRWRWPMKEYWASLIAEASRIRLFDKPGAEYNFFNLENFVYRQAGNAVATMISLEGVDRFQERLKERGTKPNPKYLALLNQCKGVTK